MFKNDRLKVSRLLVSVLLIVMLIPSLVWAKEALPVAEDLEVEKRMLAITMDLRCLVCQNESIADSRADFSNDMRREIRQKIKENKSDEEIIQFLVDRYGDFVLYNPPMKPTTLLLWFGPILLFVIGFISLLTFLKRRREQIEEISLSEAEQTKAENLLNEKKR
ncbi:MAG TPA: cytochrome c-type biogenesis protein CcmH [Nitrosomonas sp.]|nr:cytochrome c-type biogenesis protein CcmH [Nitrosomonas sp.]HQX14199.1 cytochrome c-type biogenesis protein CcmH [Nitrosomonas sp.]HRB20448.1 cytochrome c-type biogenesis protein CcmH [Nitrosomonas sp.]HRB33027.1 cytochrome c-type biogenesis protein CcmH [Nitrosomonas sp.]HRB46329.1 cytochrome c-type biogenesis protein CcmH [Nitrosomonas sp.]